MSKNYYLRNVSNLLNRLTPVRTNCSSLTMRQANMNFSGAAKSGNKFKTPVSWTSLALIGLAGGFIIYTSKKMQDEKRIKKAERASQAVGKAAIGGPFSLVDHDDNPKTDESYLGKWILIYFGFTFCPDICPEELEKIGNVIDKLDQNELIPQLNPLLISVDPVRDTPKKIKEYLKDFHPKIVGLTGTSEQIDQVAKNYRVYYSQSKPDSDNDYLVDHTIITYLVNPKGEFVDYYGKNKTEAQMTAGITQHMLTFKHSS